MRHRTSILVDDKHNRKTCIEQFTLTLWGWLMNRCKDFLKRNNRHDCRNYVTAVFATHHRRCHCESHFLAGPDNLWPTENQTAAVHFGKDFTHALIDLFASVRWIAASVRGPYRERDQIRIFLQGLL